MDLRLQGKNVFISGAGQGLGQALGLAFATEGANVAFHFYSSGAGAAEPVAQAIGLGSRPWRWVPTFGTGPLR